MGDSYYGTSGSGCGMDYPGGGTGGLCLGTSRSCFGTDDLCDSTNGLCDSTNDLCDSTNHQGYGTSDLF